MKNNILFLQFLILFQAVSAFAEQSPRTKELFCKDWLFHLGDLKDGQKIELNDSDWRKCTLPHDWSIEGEFSADNPATPGGGALPGGTGWYRKYFNIPETVKDKLVLINFDGIYRNSEVWINGHYLGKRPYGYSSFQYELTPYLNYGDSKNIIAVKVDNSKQPNSRWYSGSGIYRNVWLEVTDKVLIDHWGTFITTPQITETSALVDIKIKIRNTLTKDVSLSLKTEVFDADNKKAGDINTKISLTKNSTQEFTHQLKIEKPYLWSIENPYLYKTITTIEYDGKIYDEYPSTFGIRSFEFDVQKGFLLNGKQVKINGVCNHHDLGCLGAAINKRAIERQLEILKAMGCNGIRTSHNPPAPELLDLCDKMGFIVMDEAFDMWKKKKTDYDYSLDWDEWHKRDLEDMVLRDRNHPSIFIWSIGNEIIEQWDSSGISITKELVNIVKNLDDTRPVTSNLNDPKPSNYLYRSGALDLVGFSYHQQDFISFPDSFPGQKFIGSETVSSLATRGYYDMPSDSIRRWPIRWDIPFTTGNPDNTCSAYDNVSAPWGSTQEETWKIIKKYDFMSGQYIWTGFDYLGEPTPYSWPSRSSYFGLVDLAGFPKDTYYLYQSEWTNKPILHLFPHWNWKEGQIIDVWVYSNCEEVELFLNGKSVGVKKKSDGLHLFWRLQYTPGTLKAIGRNNGKVILEKEVKTASSPAKIILESDRNVIQSDGNDLSFVTVKILDKDNNIIPYADNLIQFDISGNGKIAGVDNGLQTSHESFRANSHKAFNGLCLVIVQAGEEPGNVVLKAHSEGLESSEIIIRMQ